MAEKEIGLCLRCGKEFKKNNAQHLYCWDCQHVPYRNRYLILDRDKFQCAYCGAKSFKGATLNVDHIVPKSDGGEDKARNLITSCNECNRAKGERRLSNEIEHELLAEVEGRNEESGIRPDTDINVGEIVIQ